MGTGISVGHFYKDNIPVEKISLGIAMISNRVLQLIIIILIILIILIIITILILTTTTVTIPPSAIWYDVLWILAIAVTDIIISMTIIVNMVK